MEVHRLTRAVARALRQAGVAGEAGAPEGTHRLSVVAVPAESRVLLGFHKTLVPPEDIQALRFSSC